MGTKCKICLGKLLTHYASDNKTKVKLPIGKICPRCDTVHDPTQFFLELRKQRLEKKEKKPKFSRTLIDERCPKCKSIKIKHRKKREYLFFYFDNNELRVQKNNPSIDYECLKCDNKWGEGLPTPQNPKYLLPPRLTKEKLRLAFQRTMIKDMLIPKSLNKLKKEVLRELEQERKAKEARDLEELVKR